MIIGPDLSFPLTADPPDMPELPVEPDNGPTPPPGNPTDPPSPIQT
ncbi:MAG TPA: stereocilin [Variovorax sp.]